MRTTTEFTIERSFVASVEEVWEAWTDPDEAQHWWHPRSAHTPRQTISIDARPGGRYRYTMIDDATGQQYPVGGRYLEVTRPHHLAFTWGHPDDDPDRCPVITVTLTPDDEGCRMTFTMRRVDQMHDDIRDGWEQAVEILSDHLAGAGKPTRAAQW